MEKAVMFSIHPKWCLEIVGGGKKLEVRRTRPEIEPPFKCYIYQTLRGCNPCQHPGVIGEFICDKVTKIVVPPRSRLEELDPKIMHSARMGYMELESYAGDSPLFGFHISGLKIYSRPKPITDFRGWCPHDLECESCAMYNNYLEQCMNSARHKKRPPQSWYYVEELCES